MKRANWAGNTMNVRTDLSEDPELSGLGPRQPTPKRWNGRAGQK